MKRFLSLVLAAMLAVGTCIVPVGSYGAELTSEQKAVVLNSMNIITGDGTSFQLGQSLKRSEAATFIIKILGVQSDLITNAATYRNTGFKDVPSTEWYAPYVGYCVKNGIITGYPDGTFKPNEMLGEKAFYSMLLKTLGYSSQDYDWNSVYRKALEAGISKNMLNAFSTEDNSKFLRGQVVETIHLALSAKHKNSEKYLIENLIQNNIVTKEFASKNGFMKIDLLPMSVTGTRLIDGKAIELTMNENVAAVPISNVKVYPKGNPASLLTVTEANVAGNKVIIKTVDPMPLQIYTVELVNISDADNNVVASVKGEYTSAAQSEVKSTLFRISKIEPVNYKSFIVTFTHPVNETAELQLLYNIQHNGKPFVEGGFKTLSIKRSPDRNTSVLVTLLTQTMVEGQKYDLTIKGDMTSTLKMNLNNGDGDTMSLFAKNTVSTVAATAITEVYSQEFKSVIVELSQKVDRTAALNRNNYILLEKDTNKVITPTAVYMTTMPDKSGKQVVLKFELPLVLYRPYQLTVRNLMTEFQTEKIPEMSFSFTTALVQNQSLAVNFVQAVDRQTIHVHFNRELSNLNSFVGVYLDNGMYISKRMIDPTDPRILKLYLNSTSILVGSTNYKMLVYPGVVDFADRTLADTAVVNFYGSDIIRPHLTVDSASFTTIDTIAVKFSQPIDSTNKTGDKFEVYHYDGKVERLIVPEVLSLSDDGIVVLKLPVLMAGGSYSLKCKNVLDITGMSSGIISGIVIKNDVK